MAVGMLPTRVSAGANACICEATDEAGLSGATDFALIGFAFALRFEAADFPAAVLAGGVFGFPAGVAFARGLAAGVAFAAFGA